MNLLCLLYSCRSSLGQKFLLIDLDSVSSVANGNQPLHCALLFSSAIFFMTFLATWRNNGTFGNVSTEFETESDLFHNFLSVISTRLTYAEKPPLLPPPPQSSHCSVELMYE